MATEQPGAEEASLIGSTFADRYRILGPIGEGGMGVVLRAEQLVTGQTVALKLLQPEFVGVEEVAQRFEREAKVTAQLSHPHIVKVVEFGQCNGRLFLAMELLEGTPLTSLIEGRATFLDIIRGEDLVLATDLMVPFAHWITPEFAPKN